MKPSLKSICSICLLLVPISIVHAEAFRISGKYIFFPEQQSQTSAAQTQVGILSSSRVTVEQQVTNEDGEQEVAELASGEFRNGTVTITGTIAEPGLAEIHVHTSDDKEPLSVVTFLESASDIRFVLMEHEVDYIADKLVLVGESRKSTDKSAKFSISGTLTSSTFGSDLATTTVTARTHEYDTDGGATSFDFGEALLDNGSFLIEADIVEPKVVSIYIDEVFASYLGALTIAEPGAEISVSQKGAGTRMFATSEGGRHAQLIDSWQESDEYVAAFNAWEQAYAKYQAEMAAQYIRDTNASVDQAPEEEEPSSATTAESAEKVSSKTAISNEESANTDELSENDEASQPIAVTDYNFAAGCEHVDLSEVEQHEQFGLGMQPKAEVHTHQKYQEQMWDLEAKSLEKFALNVDEPMNSLLALELGAFSASNESEAVRLYEELSLRLDPDIVARRVEPARDEIVESLVLEENRKNVAPGQRAPEFALADEVNNEIALYDVLESMELVLLDFWASWCGPCIASFPHLKQIYSAYKDNGFEIVSVAIDDTLEEWEQASEEQELPWINLGENNGWEGPVTNMYAVDRLPYSLLLDSKGCILRRNISPSTLEELLATRYGSEETSQDYIPTVETDAPN